MNDTSHHAVDLMLDNLPGEEWRSIVGWDQFAVSNKGRIKRLSRRAASGYRYKGVTVTFIPERLLNTTTRREINISQSGRKGSFSVAELVLSAFVEPRPSDRPIARHLDDDFTNNDLSNLAWGTRRDNRLDSSRNGIQSAGSEWARKVSVKLKGKPRSPEVWARIRATRAARGNYNWSGR